MFREKQVVSIELRKVYRQSDPVFIGILDNIRTSQATDRDLSLLNARVTSGQSGLLKSDSLAITLSTTRDTVDFINTQHLEELPGDPVILNGATNGDFPETMMPTPIQLELKVGAQVIFIKNDMDHRWVNGTLGIVIGLDEDGTRIYVRWMWSATVGLMYAIPSMRWRNALKKRR